MKEDQSILIHRIMGKRLYTLGTLLRKLYSLVEYNPRRAHSRLRSRHRSLVASQAMHSIPLVSFFSLSLPYCPPPGLQYSIREERL